MHQESIFKKISQEENNQNIKTETESYNSQMSVDNKKIQQLGGFPRQIRKGNIRSVINLKTCQESFSHTYIWEIENWFGDAKGK